MTITAPITDEGQRAKALDMISRLNLEKEWEVTIRRKVKRRSLSQNSLLWLWHQHMADFSGHSVDEIHEFIKEMFLPPREITICGQTVGVRSTKLLTKPEFKEFLDQYYAWAAVDMKVYLPVPEELGRVA